MDDSLFGPWKLDPPINKWHEFKIGKLDAWYQVSANSLQPATSDKSSDKLSERSLSDTQNSLIPRLSKKTKSNQSIQEPVENSPEKFAPKPQPRFGIRDKWDEPRSFELFISAPQYSLLGWPTSFSSIDEAIGSSKELVSPKQPSGRPQKQRKSGIPTKR
ncbi:hypothetical protein TVAG_184030 [Trichomonas vaginalis G3]|uniref:Uncharacterized protein n=1 Tax=Trichomonas vaginalis (strain ATCC PRA-98 / G3) TaxID=412133 RepID=A2D9D9_TRIV3|nr:hypothetical protein TVAGG3_0479450 [Trichomonas vaginalis G3]EAY23165.1 hypothetical protein TVAG_184030 [Trichomonas vaginalis G3]KAI5515594.1 hypothetical protein TVAGG3_0479450 [Trichomonas vaginalis G3]|eukprot:XP_001584151.1 hypothetical protein [Trichomonas vaginalis G3]